MKVKNILLVCVLIMVFMTPVVAQQYYGVGDNVDVPYVAPGTLVLDGNADESAWDDAATVNIAAFWDGAWSGNPVQDNVTETKLLWTHDTLYVYVRIEDFQEFCWGPDGNPGGGEQILIGIDRTVAGDSLYDESFGGAPQNAPDQGPFVYKIWRDAVTLNFGADVVPADSGWVDGSILVDEDNFIWGVELALWMPRIQTNSMIGFNIGGATATPDTAFLNEFGECTYAFFAWHPTPEDFDEGRFPQEPIAGDLMRDARSFGQLTFIGGPGQYGIGDELQVPYVSPGALTLDGVANEPEWNDAASFDIAAFWDGAWSGNPVQDNVTDSRVLWSEDWVYVYVRLEDFQEFCWGPEGNPGGGEQILLGFDPQMRGDDPETGFYDESFGGAPENAPALGPYAYKIWRDAITLNFGEDIVPADSGWVQGSIFVDEDNFIWGVEMGAYVPQAALNTRIGFNGAGATATPDTTFLNEFGECTYAFFAWHPQPSDTTKGYPSDFIAGDIMRRAKSFGTLFFVDMATSVRDSDTELVPENFALKQNYPNPFNPRTSIQYDLRQQALVELTVHNVLGQKVATLFEGGQPSGQYIVQWNAENAASGLYFYQLRVDNKLVATKKMLLVK